MNELNVASRLSASEPLKETRRQRLRERFSRISQAYERSLRRHKPTVTTAYMVVGIAVGAVVYLWLFEG